MQALACRFFDFACFVGCCGAPRVSLRVRNERMYAGALLDAAGVCREEKPGFCPNRLCYGDDCRIRGWNTCRLSYAAIAPVGMLAPLVLVLTIAFATVFVFSDESLVIEIDYEEPADLNDGRLARCEHPKTSDECGLMVSGRDAIAVAVVSPEDEMRRNDDKISEFCAERGLTARESEVFSLWITGA